MRVVVTGGAGFIGKHLLDWLVAEGDDGMAIDDMSRGRQEHVPPLVSLQCIDLSQVLVSDLARMFDAFGAEAVIHLAGVHFIPECIRSPERTFAINTKSTHVLVE